MNRKYADCTGLHIQNAPKPDLQPSPEQEGLMPTPGRLP